MSLIGNEIRRTRKRIGMTAKALAGQTGLSPQFVGDVELGRRIPTLETMLLFCNVFPDADSGRWAWLVIRDQYGDGMFALLWKHAQAAGADRASTGVGQEG